MNDHAWAEDHPEPPEHALPVDARQLDRMDDDLHWGWAWQRYQYVFRRPEGLRILDAGCGTGASTLALAALNPGASATGLDRSAPALEVARRRASVAGMPAVDLREHDLDTPIAGTYDFIACRGVVGRVGDPSRLLAHLARALDDRGLLLLTVPAREGRRPRRLLRRAVAAIAPRGADLGERAAVGVELWRALRPDHPIRRLDPGSAAPGARAVARWLRPAEAEWSLEDAIGLLEAAGLRFLYAATARPWEPARVFGPAVPGGLQVRVAGLDDRARSLLVDALDPTLHEPDYRLYATPEAHEPRAPGWPERLRDDPRTLDDLIPHPTGLSRPGYVHAADDPATARGRATYRAVGGFVGEVDGEADRALRLADGRRSIGAIDRELNSPGDRAARWLGLAGNGFLLLEPGDARQYVDCTHLGPIRDRLDCACPRRWVRACDLHGLTTIDNSSPDPRPLAEALSRLGADGVACCARCLDYAAEK